MVLLWGCAPLGLVTGAVPLALGQRESGADVQVARAPDALSVSTGLPLPAVSLHYRVGLGQEADIGFHLYSLGLGSGVDLRYRWLHQGPWSMAIDPRIDFLFIPFGKAFSYGLLDVALPLVVEKELGGGWSGMVVSAFWFRETLFLTGDDQVSTHGSSFLALVGGGEAFATRGEN